MQNVNDLIQRSTFYDGLDEDGEDITGETV
jgi:hypothetical protein